MKNGVLAEECKAWKKPIIIHKSHGAISCTQISSKCSSDQISDYDLIYKSAQICVNLIIFSRNNVRCTIAKLWITTISSE